MRFLAVPVPLCVPSQGLSDVPAKSLVPCSFVRLHELAPMTGRYAVSKDKATHSMAPPPYGITF